MNDEDQAVQRRGNVGTEIFEQIEKIMQEESLSRTNAFQRLSELTGRRAGPVAANYYRVARQRGATLRPRARRGSKGRPAAARAASTDGADAALSRAMESLQELAGSCTARRRNWPRYARRLGRSRS